MAKRRINVERGFWNATGFHPLRRSRDYDEDRAGDDYGSKADRKGFGKKKRNPAKSVSLKGFTGTVTRNTDGTVSIRGRKR
jgi:hypothetical protein